MTARIELACDHDGCPVVHRSDTPGLKETLRRSAAVGWVRARASRTHGNGRNRDWLDFCPGHRGDVYTHSAVLGYALAPIEAGGQP